MISIILRNWFRHRERLILLIVGILVISIGLSTLVSLTETNKGTVKNTIEQNWKTSYHMVVLPQGNGSSAEDKGLLEPNFMSGVTGGISLEQYQQIKDVEDIEVAAPIAILGDLPLSVQMGSFTPPENDNGIYKLEYIETVDNGYHTRIQALHTKYLVAGSWHPGISTKENPSETFGALPWQSYAGNHVITSRNLLVGIDPQQEAKLVGLDKASTQYFSENDKPFIIDKNANQIQIPLLLSSQPFSETKYKYQLEKLELDFPKEQSQINELMKSIRDKGGVNYLKSLESKKITSNTYSSQEAYKAIYNGLLGQKENDSSGKYLNTTTVLGEKIGPLVYKNIQSPFPERWESAYSLETQDTVLPWAQDRTYAFREVEKIKDLNDYIRLNLSIVGAYHPEELNVAKDPLTELPLDTYRPASAKLVLDEDGKPINPPVDLTATNNPVDFLLQPPTVLTTIEAASEISALQGKEPISAIRIKVKGADKLESTSHEKLKDIASLITKKTGLKVKITLGSSPQSVLSFIPENNSVPALGWIEQPWINLGAAFTILKETKLGYSSIILTVLLVAIVYVIMTRLIAFLTNRKQYALLLALGWSTSQLKKILILESFLLGSIAFITICISQFVLHLVLKTEFSLILSLLTGFAGLLIYFLGSLWPAKLVGNIEPYEALKTGEITLTMKRLFYSNTIFGIALQYLFGKTWRTIVSIIALAIPVTLLVNFIVITYKLEGVMYTSYLGEYVALEISTFHYVASIIAIVMAILIIAEIMWQNVTERKPEISLLKAVGWDNSMVRKLVIYEGVFIGVFSGILSLGLSLVLIWLTYSEFSVDSYLVYLILPIILPVVSGVIGSLIPAEMAARIAPMVGIKK
ncbi:ABC transporter permease [Bacillus infantis]|uniref:ABC transporter permease n=1 Tax=Bacillus infantis TaxID=324767 RepID=UPI003CF729B8